MRYLAISKIAFFFFVSTLYTKVVTKDLKWVSFNISDEDASEIAKNATNKYNEENNSSYEFENVTEVEWNQKPLSPERPFGLKVYFYAQYDYTDFVENTELVNKEDLYVSAYFCVICKVDKNDKTVITVLKLSNEDGEINKECKLENEENKKNVKTTTASIRPPR